VADALVVNASPLIFLAGSSRLDLLARAGGRIEVPKAVAEEIRRFGPRNRAAEALDRMPWLQVVEDALVPPSVMAWDLGPGESAVLARAIAHPVAAVVLDDLEARLCARAHGLEVRGTLGLVVEARRRGDIPSARAVMEELRAAGMYLTDRVLNRALAEVGE
jgi:predicted nucleic acid-binding protein